MTLCSRSSMYGRYSNFAQAPKGWMTFDCHG